MKKRTGTITCADGEVPRESSSEVAERMDPPASEVCPLCESFQRTEIKTIPYAEIWSGLEKQWGASFSREVVERHTPCEFTTLVECNHCGLQYFVPIVGGNFEFYRQLSRSPRYYNQTQWEFDLVATKMRLMDRVLDIGCGDGSFLKRIRQRVQQAVGIDTNPMAVTRAKAAGCDAVRTDIFDFVQNHEGVFDWVCCFHVIEHLPRITAFVNAAVSCLKPNGSLILSLPNRQRILQDPLEALDCPPHHVSRWGPKALQKLGEIMGLSLTEINFEMANRKLCGKWFREEHLRAFKLPDSIKRGIARIFFAAPLFAIYRSVGRLKEWGLYGFTILAIYRKVR